MASDFRTKIDVQPYPFSLGYSSPTMFCGSCFTENIGSLMVERKFPILVNPFGVVYNPISVKLVIESILNAQPFDESDLKFRNGLWYSYLHHTSYSSPDKEKCLESINTDLLKASSFAKDMEYLLVTFGTARVFYLKENNQPVANCHKISAKEFDNQLLSVEEILNSWSALMDDLLMRIPDLKIIFTISPVRHWKDGAIGNQQSKSILNVAVHELIKQYPNNAFYFPAYELLMDDLRDYRFYADDMLHPSKVTVNYIWEKFVGSIISSKAIRLMGDVEKIIAAVNHKPFNPKTKEHNVFITNILKQIKTLERTNPLIDFEREAEYLTSFL
ncbi:MAG: GSCFA domain protein [Bacteroidales bacterium]|nr:MAG: GSCFA domain protein [Bacteroidales bacterium]